MGMNPCLLTLITQRPMNIHGDPIYCQGIHDILSLHDTLTGYRPEASQEPMVDHLIHLVHLLMTEGALLGDTHRD